jgi:hypothetical protein
MMGLREFAVLKIYARRGAPAVGQVLANDAEEAAKNLPRMDTARELIAHRTPEPLDHS